MEICPGFPPVSFPSPTSKEIEFRAAIARAIIGDLSGRRETCPHRGERGAVKKLDKPWRGKSFRLPRYIATNRRGISHFPRLRGKRNRAGLRRSAASWPAGTRRRTTEETKNSHRQLFVALMDGFSFSTARWPPPNSTVASHFPLDEFHCWIHNLVIVLGIILGTVLRINWKKLWQI